ncbi:MAG: MBL fold metallo-hydrolase [Candidatus Hodarchaeota archaeon]
MKIQKIGARGAVFSFYHDYIGDTTNVYVIQGSKHIFLCDTFLGPIPMNKVLNYLQRSDLLSKPIVVFNSHSHWDHHWGNCSFQSSLILSHEQCRENIATEEAKTLLKLKEHQQGRVEIIPPNAVFAKRILFPEEQVEFFHTPGHTADSASCLDQRDRVLFAADNIERPFPYLYEADLNCYIKTLEGYLTSEIKAYIPGHGEICFDKTMIQENLEYLRSFKSQTVKVTSLTKAQLRRHFANLETLGIKAKN